MKPKVNVITIQSQLIFFNAGRYLTYMLWHNTPKTIKQEDYHGHNMIQFQKGLSLTKFLSKYSSEARCRETLFHMRWPNGFVCANCEATGHCEISERKVCQCNSCHSQTSLTSGTIFADINLPITVWFLGIYFITQSKEGISSLKLARTLGISANASLRMKHKLQQVMKERQENKSLSGLIQIDHAYIGGKRSDGKRVRGVPIK